MVKKLLLFVMCFVLLCSMDECRNKPTTNTNTPTNPIITIATNAPAPEKTKSPDEQNSDILKKKLEEAEKKANEAVERGDIIAKLSAEKEALVLKTQLAESYVKQWKANAESYKDQTIAKEEELKVAKLDAWKEKLWWMSGICGFLAIVAGGVAWGFPLLRPVAVKASLILAAIAGIMLFVAQSLTTISWLLGLVPYIIGVAGLIALVYIFFAIRHWWMDHSGLKQTIQGIEPLKEDIEGFSDHMLKYVDDTMVNHVKNIRGKLGLRKALDPEKEALKKQIAELLEKVKE